MVVKPLYLAGLSMRVTMLSATLPALASVFMAQVPLGNLPSAGKVLGWEFNMNRQYTQQMNGSGAIQRPNAAEPPVIFYENQERTQSPRQPPYLLNTPQHPMK